MDGQQKLKARAFCAARDREARAFTLSYVQTTARMEPRRWPSARVEVQHSGRLYAQTATGCGAFDAICNALNSIVGVDARLEKLDLRYLSRHPAAVLPEVLAFAVLRIGSVRVQGSAQAEDVMLACARSYLAALEGYCRGRLESDPKLGCGPAMRRGSGPVSGLGCEARP